MEEKYFLYDILECEKNLVNNMAIALNEASCDKIYKLYYELFEFSSEISKDLFNFAYNKSWYSLEAAETEKINKELQKMVEESKNF